MKKNEKNKKTESEPRWVEVLRTLMNARALNPRSLSLKAGLNPTAVRDMLEGRVKYPRYDTVESLARALGVTPVQLMGGEPATAHPDPDRENDLALLTEIIARLQEVAEDYRHNLKPHDFAAMVTAIYRQVKPVPGQKTDDLVPQIKNLMAYERLRGKES